MQRCGEQSPKFEAFGSDESGPWHGYQIRRADLDGVLLSRATDLGVCLMQPVRAVTLTHDAERISAVETDQGRIQADIVLDASGSNRFVSRVLSTRWHQHSRRLTARYGYVNLQHQAAATSPNPLIRYDDCGWTWIAQIAPNSFAWVRLRFDGSDPGQDWIPETFKTWKDKWPSRGADVTWRISEQLAGNNWFLLGDAAAVLDPSSGHGTLRAMMSGVQAAHLVAETLTGNISSLDAAKAYEAWLREWFDSDVQQLRELADSQHIQKPNPQTFETSTLNPDVAGQERP